MRSTVLSTPTSLRPRKASLQQGQAIVLIALLILVLFGMLGLAIDSGRGYVDRRDQQSAVDASALAAGDWYENYSDLPLSINQSVALYERNLRLYGGVQTFSQLTSYVGPTGALRQDTYTYTFAGSYTLTIVATDTQFNGYQFVYTTNHNLPLAFMQVFGGGLTIPISATATSVVGNQRQTPALLTLSTDKCSTNLTGSAQLTVLGDVYSNGTACLDANLHEAGNCYGAAGSNCSDAQFYCYNDSPGFVPYPPPCAAGDILGSAVVPAPTLPDPGFLAPSVGFYSTAQGYNQYNRGTWTEMFPGVYGNFHLSGGSASCAFLDAGVYTWTNDYSSDAAGSLLSNELRPPDEELWSAPGTSSVASPQFWDQNGVSCAGHFTVTNSAAQTILTGPACTDLSPQAPAGCHSGVTDTKSRNNRWGVEVTSVRYDRFLDSNTTPNPCYSAPGCRRESAPSSCHLTPTAVGGGLHSPSNIGISINITQNAPGAEYYNVYLNPQGCNGQQDQFGWVGRFNAPGFLNGIPTGTYPSGTAWTLGALTQSPGVPTAGATLYDITDLMIANPAVVCYAQSRTIGCTPTDDEDAPWCFSNCPPPANLLSQQNAPMSLEYPPYYAGDVANENFCQPSPNPGNINSPCLGSAVTPGGVQFYFPAGSCFNQNSQGATYVFAGVQYNWIVIYAPASNTCSANMNGGASTQYIGTIYTPGMDWTISGGDRSPLAGQVICYTAKVAGGGQAGIDFNPNYSPVPPAARLIN
jgi:Flp pilus assembly protein TadG